MQIMPVVKRLSKFGTALVIETTARSGSFNPGFRINPPKKLDLDLKVPFPLPPFPLTSRPLAPAPTIYLQQLIALTTTARHRPNFGIEFTAAETAAPLPLPPKPQQDVVVIFNSDEAAGDA